jgi:hypothetical protein
MRVWLGWIREGREGIMGFLGNRDMNSESMGCIFFVSGWQIGR